MFLTLIIGIESNFNCITKLSIGFANIENVYILMNNTIKSFQSLIAMCNWHRKYTDTNAKMMKSRSIVQDECN